MGMVSILFSAAAGQDDHSLHQELAQSCTAGTGAAQIQPQVHQGDPGSVQLGPSSPSAGFFSLLGWLSVSAYPGMSMCDCPAQGFAHLTAGVLLAEDERAPKTSLQSGICGELQ